MFDYIIKITFCSLFAISISLFPLNGHTEEIRVAVASNFTETIKVLAPKFEEKTGNKVTLSFGSTGKHYAQIKNGAPFDIFLSADERSPELLENEGIALAGSRFTYAQGKLVLWSSLKNYVDNSGEILKLGDYQHLAMANPRLAPYGKAAEEVLEALELRNTIPVGRIVHGENINQTFQFVKSGNAELGFLSFSQVKSCRRECEGSFWEIPQDLYQPIRQQAVLLKESQAASAFLDFIKSNESREIIREHGYEIS